MTVVAAVDRAHGPAVILRGARSSAYLGAALWLVSRLVAILFVVTDYGSSRINLGDLHYYADELHSLTHGGSLVSTLHEYPLPALLVIAPQYALALGDSVRFVFVFVASMLVLDAAFTRYLWRCADRRLSFGLAFWLAFVPALGPIVFYRFDLVPAVLAAVGLLLALRRPAVSGALLALASVIKIWPLSIVLAVILRHPRRRPLLRMFGIVVAAAAGATLLLSGTQRLLSPLSFQSGRGLQSESVAATPFMLWRAWHGPVNSSYSAEYQSIAVTGPGVNVAVLVTNLLIVAAIVLLAWLAWRTHRHASPANTAWFALTAALAITVVNKVLSPQYLIWVGALAAAVFTLEHTGTARYVAAGFAVAAACLTQLAYPALYIGLSGDWMQHTASATYALAARNVLICGMFACAAITTWRRTRWQSRVVVGEEVQ